MIIHFLTTENCWFQPHLDELQHICDSKGHDTRVFHNTSSLESGDILFILSYYRILSKEELSKHNNNIVVHASDLPRGKGFSPMAWQILEGSHQIPFTLFEATEACDSGDYYLKNTLSLEGNETYEQWRDLEGKFIVRLACEFLDAYPQLKPVPQEGPESLYRRRTHADDEIDATDTVESIFDKLRICDPEHYPAWFSYRGRKFKLKIEEWE